MTTEQTAEQLELAAQILRTGHPYEFCERMDRWIKHDGDVMAHIRHGDKIRPILATPPDGRPLHNPNNLTAEQVGAGFRLTLKDESAHKDAELWNNYDKKWVDRLVSDVVSEYGKNNTYRLPFSVPWPEPQPDPYAELKKAHAEGKVIQFRSVSTLKDGHWLRPLDLRPGDILDWEYPVECFRIKPDAPPFQLPPPPPSMQWHSTAEWQESDLPQGMRPLVADEFPMEGDECIAKQLESKWHPSNNWRDGTKASWCCNYRTTRPLVFTHAGKQWTYHRPGDPMPCDGERRIDVLMASSYPMTGSNPKLVRWSKLTLCDGSQAPGDVIGWRYAEPTTKEVELGPEDVPPGSVFRSKDQPDTSFWTVSQVWTGGFYLRGENVDWPLAMQRMEINRSVPLTGKWNPDAWEPCHKTI